MFRTDEVDLRHYGLILRRWKRVILGAVGVCVALAVIFNVVTVPAYQATTRLEVRKEPSRSALTGAETGADDWHSDNVTLFTAAELITSRGLMRDVVETLRAKGLLRIDPPRAQAWRRLTAWFAAIGAARSAPAGATGAQEPEIDWLLSILKVTPIRDTRLISIEVEHWDRETARGIAETVASRFVESQRQQRASADTSRLALLRQRMGEIKGQIDGHENTSNQVGVPVLESKVRQLTQTIADLNTALIQTRTERLSTSAKMTRIKRIMDDSGAVMSELPVESPTLDQLRRDLLQRETDLARAREVYKDKHPKLVMLESERQSIRDNIRSELSKTASTLKGDYSMLDQREGSLRGAIAQAEEELRQVNAELGRTTTVESEAKSDKDLYALLSSKVQEVQISGEVGPSLATVVEPATVGEDPVRPRKLLNLMLASVVGLVSGVGLALLLEYFMQSIRTPKDVTELLQLPVLGTIPKRS